MHEWLPAPPLRPFGGIFTPSPDQTLLLQAALAPEPVATPAYERWRRHTELTDLDVASQRVLPLLVRRLADPSATAQRDGPGDPMLDRCRNVARFTWLKSRVLMTEAASALAVLAEAGVPAMLLKGAAVIHHDGGHVAWRPMDDVDVAVPTGRAAAALDALVSAGYTTGMPTLTDSELGAWLRAHHGLPLTGPRGAELDLHWHVLAGSSHPQADDEFWARAVPATLAGVDCLATGREDTLVNVIAHAIWSAGQPGLRWATDVAALVGPATGARTADGDPGPGIDWDLVVETARRHRIAVAVADALDLLRTTIGLEVADGVVAQLRRAPVAERIEQWPRRDTAGRYRLPSTPETLVGAYQTHLRTTLSPGTTPRRRDLVDFLRHWWGVDGPPVASPAGWAGRVAAHGAFVALGRPWRLRQALLGPSRGRRGLPVAFGQCLSFRLGGDGQGALGPGWSCPEPHGTWSVGAGPVVELRLPGRPSGPLDVQVRLAVFVTALRPRLAVDVVANGAHRARWTFDNPGPMEHVSQFDVPTGVVDRSGLLRLQFIVDRPLTPDAARYGADNRTLGIALASLSIAAG